MSLPARPAARLGLTASEAARHLGVSISTLRRWSDAGHVQAYRTPGGQRRFSRAQIEQFVRSLQQGEAPSAAPDERVHVG